MAWFGLLASLNREGAVIIWFGIVQRAAQLMETQIAFSNTFCITSICLSLKQKNPSKPAFIYLKKNIGIYLCTQIAIYPYCIELLSCSITAPSGTYYGIDKWLTSSSPAFTLKNMF